MPDNWAELLYPAELLCHAVLTLSGSGHAFRAFGVCATHLSCKIMLHCNTIWAVLMLRKLKGQRLANYD